MDNDDAREIPQVSEHSLLSGARERVDEALVHAAAEPERWGRSLMDAVSNLGSAFSRHIAVAEGPGGTLEVVMERRPALEHAVRVQRREHLDLASDLERLGANLAEAVERGAVDADTLRWQVAPIQDAVRRHMARANDLLFEAFNRDDGGEG
jgi:hypothetical protein